MSEEEGEGRRQRKEEGEQSRKREEEGGGVSIFILHPKQTQP